MATNLTTFPKVELASSDYHYAQGFIIQRLCKAHPNLSMDDAEDYAAQAISHVLQRWDPSRGKGLRNWLCRGGLFKARSLLSGTRQPHKYGDEVRHPAQMDPNMADLTVDRGAAGPGEALDQQEQFDNLLTGLNKEAKRLISLKFKTGLTIKEISLRVGVIPRTVKARLAAALESIRARVEEEG